jgi:hypothetical protein
MQPTSAAKLKKPGRKALSPNGLDREMTREDKHRHRH